MNSIGKGQKVFVGLSGGVDSSVAALLLLKNGFNVTGVFIKITNDEFPNCDFEKERIDAKRIATFLNIPFLDLDLSLKYKEHIFSYMINSYRDGLTPNPDIFCNKFIKFGYFLDFALKQGADFVSTGHYCQIKNNQLIKAIDNNKDQSYFLSYLKKELLEKIIFPIGHLEKKEVRDIAKKNKLFNFSKKDSQGLCFIGQLDFSNFLKKQFKISLGQILDMKGEIIGKHQGAIFYTIGQRHGFQLIKNSPNQKKLFVVKKDFKNNILIVSDCLDDLRLFQFLKLNNLNWHYHPQVEDKLISIIRYHGEKILAQIIKIEKDYLEIKTEKNHLSISPGQVCAFYKEEVFLGSGIIIDCF